MREHAVRQSRDFMIRNDYENKRISWAEYQQQMAESRAKYFEEERASCKNYKDAIASWSFEPE